MNKEQFESLKDILYKRGYKRYDQHWHSEDYVIGKPFHNDNKWDEDRAAYQILISVYDWTDSSKEFYSRLPDNMKNTVGLAVHAAMSRTIDERLDLVFSFHDNDTIEEVERLTEAWYNAMCLIIPEPREEKPTWCTK